MKFIGNVPAFIVEHNAYEFGGVFAAARSGDLDEFDTVASTFALQYESYHEQHPVKARIARVLLGTGLPRVFARIMSHAP